MNSEIVRVDWNVFNYLHSVNVRDAFQRLTEQLFCYEFNQPYGIYRYYNQPYIETMPICYGTETIGFQSKYFDAASNLSAKKQELMDAITGAHKKYPDLTKIIFYINKEPSLSTSPQKTKPQYIAEIDAHAAELDIDIEWRGLNQIETILLHPELEHIRNYFFSINSGIRKTISQIQSHSNSIFNSIDIDIQYKQKSIKIPQELIYIETFLESSKSFLLVHGEGGCGKSALVKLQLCEEKRYPVWAFRATDFDAPSIPEFSRKFGECTWEELLSAFDDFPRKVCVIDSAERVFTITHQNTFESALSALQQHGWHVIITIRTYYLGSFLNAILKTSDVFEHRIPMLSLDTLAILEAEHQLTLPTDIKLRNFLCNLFYLKLYLSSECSVLSTTLVEFMDNLWSQVICASPNHNGSLNVRRGHMIINMVKENACKGSAYYIPENEVDWDAITSLTDSGIIQFDEVMGGYFVCHDVYEEIVLKRIISQAYNRKESSLDFFLDIGDSLVMRKAFRSWLQAQFDISPTGLKQFLSEALIGDQYPLIWKDEILIALFSEENEAYLHFLGTILESKEYFLLFRALHLLNTACRTIDDDQYRKILAAEEARKYSIYRFTKPLGQGWDYLISFTYEQSKFISWSQIKVALVSDVIYSWVRYADEGTTTRKAGLLALHLYQITKKSSFRSIQNGDKLSRICDSILYSAKEILPELSDIFESVISEKATSHGDKYTKLCEHLLKNAFSTGTLCDVAPDLVTRLARLFWLDDRQPLNEWDHTTDLGDYFGLRRFTDHIYYPSSAFQTPILSLLQSNPQKALDFIIDFFDITTAKYYKSHLNEDYTECSEIELIFPDSTRVKQIVSDRLWKLHRGTSAAPNLLESILMAFERWLYQLIELSSEEFAVNLCIKILSASHSAAITAIIANMVIAYPNKLFRIACILLHTPEIFICDIHRFTSEHASNFLRGTSPNNKIYDEERIASNALDFRKKRLEDVIIEYQFKPFNLSEEDFQTRLDLLYKAIDEGFIPEEQLPEAEHFLLYRIDTRKMKLVHTQSEAGTDGLALVSDLPDKLEQIQEENSTKRKNDDKYLQLDLWSHYRYSHDVSNYSKYEQYESNPSSALDDAFMFLAEPSLLQIDNRFLLYVASTLLVDFQDRLTEEQISICGEIIIDYLQMVVEQQGIHSVGDGTDAAIAALPSLFGKVVVNTMFDDPVILLLMLMCDWGKQRDWAINTFREKVWCNDSDLAHNLLTLFILLKPGYDNNVSRHNGTSPKTYFEENIPLIDSILQQPPQALPDITMLSKISMMTLSLFLPNSSSPFELEVWMKSGAILWSDFFAHSRGYQERENFQDYELEYAYIDWLSHCLLTSESDFQLQLIEELIEYLSISKHLNNFLTSLIRAQDQLKKFSPFWRVWNKLFDRIKALCESERANIIYKCEHEVEHYYSGELDEIVTTYLFAMPWWNENAREWHTLSGENSIFFSRAVDAFGYHPVALYSISRVLNSVGYGYIREGVIWLAKIIQNNQHLRNSILPINTDYYIEEYIQRFINSYHPEIKRSRELRKCVLDILGFLVDRGSTCGFILRENIS